MLIEVWLQPPSFEALRFAIDLGHTTRYGLQSTFPPFFHTFSQFFNTFFIFSPHFLNIFSNFSDAFSNTFSHISMKWPTGPIQSKSCDVRLFVCLFAPLVAVLLGLSPALRSHDQFPGLSLVNTRVSVLFICPTS